MTPKEKADELYWKYYLKVADSSYPEDLSKQCALIAVNLLLDTKSFLISIPLQDYKYWEEVKQEIEKL